MEWTWHRWLTSQLLRRQRSGGSRFEVSPGKYLRDPNLNKPFTKIGLVEWLKVQWRPEFKPQYHKKKKKRMSLSFFNESILLEFCFNSFSNVIILVHKQNPFGDPWFFFSPSHAEFQTHKCIHVRQALYYWATFLAFGLWFWGFCLFVFQYWGWT
jgi:hypothetical protein